MRKPLLNQGLTNLMMGDIIMTESRTAQQGLSISKKKVTATLVESGGYFFMVLNISSMINAKIMISINSSIRCHPLSGLRRHGSLRDYYTIVCRACQHDKTPAESGVDKINI